MRRGVRRTAAVALIAVLALPALQAQEPPPQRASGAVTSGVMAVLVDVTVRDRRGQPVRDLDQADFEILEDGVRQQVGSFTRVFDGAIAEGDAPRPPAATPPPASPSAPASTVGSAPPADSAPPVTALVFDRLTPEAGRLAVQAAQQYFGDKEEAPGYVGVFGIDLGLAPFAPFTRNVATLRKALDRMGSRASASFNSPEQRQQRADASQRAAMAGQAAAAAQAGGGPGAAQAAGGSPAEAQLAQMQADMLQGFETLERNQQGYATTNGLLAIIGQLRRLPGRKSLVLFSEGIAIPPAVQRLFQGVIDAANRANVSIYAMDAAGLRAESEQAKIRDQVNEAAKMGIETGYSNTGRAGGPLTQGLEENEDVLRQDPHTGLASLTQDTGGLLFENTNNLRQGFDRIETDLRNYYLIGYTPTNDKYDGKFRTIEVRVKRSGVNVGSRRGYFAVRDTGGVPINAWDAEALVALERKPVPNAFPVRAAALRFPERARPGLTPVVVDLKTAPLAFEPGSDGKTYSSDFTVLVRFLDPEKRVVRQVSQRYEVNGPIGEIERARQGDVLFYREPELPPGVYTMETVVHDALSGKASVRVSTVEVSNPDPTRLRISSLVLVKRAEKVGESERRGENPLLVNDVVLYPNLGDPVSKAEKEVGFFFALYPGGNGAAPESELQLLQSGKLLARVPISAESGGRSERIAQLGRVPLDQLAPGTYELRVLARQGGDRVSRSTVLRIAE